MTQPKIIDNDDVALSVQLRYGNDRRRYRHHHGRYQRGRYYRHYPYGSYRYDNRRYPYYRQYGHRYRHYPRGSGFTIYYSD